jgi:hypothetical protein
MEENKNIFLVYVDTSYLTNMPATEKADWNRLLKHAKACIADLNLRPRLEIHISEIALLEYRGHMIDELLVAIDETRRTMQALQKQWRKYGIYELLDYPFPSDRDMLPEKEKIDSVADQIIEKLLDSGIKQRNRQEHHGDAVWKAYFNWDPPFNVQSISGRKKDERKNRRIHIPDAWILQAAIDVKNTGHKMLCLCNDLNLSAALEAHGYSKFNTAKEVLDVLSSPPKPHDITLSASDEAETGAVEQTALDDLLSKTLNDNIKNIYLRLLGFVVPLDTPTHDSLINAVVSKGFDRKLVEACAAILSDKTRPYIKDTGSHYIVGNKEICTAAADRLTQEIIDMLEWEL